MTRAILLFLLKMRNVKSGRIQLNVSIYYYVGKLSIRCKGLSFAPWVQLSIQLIVRVFYESNFIFVRLKYVYLNKAERKFEERHVQGLKRKKKLQKELKQQQQKNKTKYSQSDLSWLSRLLSFR